MTPRRRSNKSSITRTGYKGGYLSNSAKVVVPKPLPVSRAFTVPIEARAFITIETKAGTTDRVFMFAEQEQDKYDVTAIDLISLFKQQIYAQLHPYNGMFKAVYLKNMTIEIIPQATKMQINSPPLYVKADFENYHTPQEIMTIEPICLLNPGQHRMIIPTIPSLSQQVKPAVTTSDAVITNRWVDFPLTVDDTLNLLRPRLHLYCSDYPSDPFGTKYAWMIQVRMNISLAASALLEEVTKNTVKKKKNNVGKKIVKGAKKAYNKIKPVVTSVIDIIENAAGKIAGK